MHPLISMIFTIQDLSGRNLLLCIWSALNFQCFKQYRCLVLITTRHLVLDFELQCGPGSRRARSTVPSTYAAQKKLSKQNATSLRQESRYTYTYRTPTHCSNIGITLTLFRLPSTTLCMAFVVEGTCCLGSWRRAEIQGSRFSFATRTCVESSSGFDLAVVARSLGLLRQHLKKGK